MVSLGACVARKAEVPIKPNEGRNQNGLAAVLVKSLGSKVFGGTSDGTMRDSCGEGLQGKEACHDSQEKYKR